MKCVARIYEFTIKHVEKRMWFTLWQVNFLIAKFNDSDLTDRPYTFNILSYGAK